MSRLSEALSLIVQPIMAAINRNQRSTDAAASIANTANKAASVLKSKITKLEAYEEETYALASTANDTANSALNKANEATSAANVASGNANSAKIIANSALSNAESALGKANSAVNTANSAVNTANTANNTATEAKSAANSALDVANSANSSVSNLARVATSGSFKDLVDKPTILTNGPNHFIINNVFGLGDVGRVIKYDSSRNIVVATTGDCFDGVITGIINGSEAHCEMIGLGTKYALFYLTNSEAITPGMHDFVVADDPKCIRLATDEDDPTIIRRLRVTGQNGVNLYTVI